MRHLLLLLLAWFCISDVQINIQDQKPHTIIANTMEEFLLSVPPNDMMVGIGFENGYSSWLLKNAPTDLLLYLVHQDAKELIDFLEKSAGFTFECYPILVEYHLDSDNGDLNTQKCAK